MIEKRYIESARQIRKEFIRLSKELDNNKKDVQDLSDFLLEKVNELDDIKSRLQKGLKSNDDVLEFSQKILSKISEIEDKEKSMTNNINSINEKINKLREEEIQLFKIMKSKHSDMSDDDIRKEVHSRLEE